MNNVKWSKTEKKIARAAFEKAHEKECESLIKTIQKKASKLKEHDDIWELYRFLGKLSPKMEKKYDYRYSMLIHVFARLIQEGWMSIDDLEGLSEDKIEQIRFLQDYKIR